MIHRRPAAAISVFCAIITVIAPSAMALDRFDGKISREQLEHFLSRAVTMEGIFHEHGDLDDIIRFLRETDARFAGRTLYFWGNEKNLNASLEAAQVRERKVHAALPDLMLQAAIFEIVSDDVSGYPLPVSVM